MSENEKPTSRENRTYDNEPYTVTGNLSASPSLQTENLTASKKNR